MSRRNNRKKGKIKKELKRRIEKDDWIDWSTLIDAPTRKGVR